MEKYNFVQGKLSLVLTSGYIAVFSELILKYVKRVFASICFEVTKNCPSSDNWTIWTQESYFQEMRLSGALKEGDSLFLDASDYFISGNREHLIIFAKKSYLMRDPRNMHFTSL